MIVIGKKLVKAEAVRQRLSGQLLAGVAEGERPAKVAAMVDSLKSFAKGKLYRTCCRFSLLSWNALSLRSFCNRRTEAFT
jgi:hypothetical protein